MMRATSQYMNALELLNSILSTSSPGDTIYLTRSQIDRLATLGERELGPLATQIAVSGACDAIGMNGLFYRRVEVFNSTAESKSICGHHRNQDASR